MTRISRLTLKAIRHRLKTDKVDFNRRAGREVIQQLLLDHLTRKFVATTVTPYAPRGKLAYSHKERMARRRKIKRSRADLEEEERTLRPVQRKARPDTGEYMLYVCYR